MTIKADLYSKKSENHACVNELVAKVLTDILNFHMIVRLEKHNGLHKIHYKNKTYIAFTSIMMGD